MSGSWVDVAGVGDVEAGDLIRVDVGAATFVLYRTRDDQWFATDGLCTHAAVHLCDGYLDGSVIECPKHNGRFDIRTGAPKGRPATDDLRCHQVRVVGDRVELLVP